MPASPAGVSTELLLLLFVRLSDDCFPRGFDPGSWVQSWSGQGGQTTSSLFSGLEISSLLLLSVIRQWKVLYKPRKKYNIRGRKNVLYSDKEGIPSWSPGVFFYLSPFGPASGESLQDNVTSWSVSLLRLPPPGRKINRTSWAAATIFFFSSDQIKLEIQNQFK